MLVGRIADALHRFTFLGARGSLGESISNTRLLERIAVQFGNILRYAEALGAVPGTLADAIAGIYSRLAGLGLDAEIGVPGAVACAGRCGQHLAALIRASDTAEIAALAGARAGYKETHGRRWLL